MRHPFLVVEKGSTWVRLHKGLYGQAVVKKLQETHSRYISSVKESKGYFLLGIRSASPDDYLELVNYLMYLHRAG